ncbi:MAG: ATP synthase F0 subunit B [Candidatus Omnitrophica bacterium]|nr:ATP synthase F0 subunit B [Candidatus Omnitrophota bacterium]
MDYYNLSELHSEPDALFANTRPMKEIVDKILREEEEARKRIEAARKQSQEALRAANDQAQFLVEKAVADAQAEAEARKQEAQRQFAAEKEKALKETQDGVASRRDEKARDIPALAHKFFLSITHIPE